VKDLVDREKILRSLRSLRMTAGHLLLRMTVVTGMTPVI
jgi:hypothetical protein